MQVVDSDLGLGLRPEHCQVVIVGMSVSLHTCHVRRRNDHHVRVDRPGGRPGGHLFVRLGGLLSVGGHLWHLILHRRIDRGPSHCFSQPRPQSLILYALLVKVRSIFSCGLCLGIMLAGGHVDLDAFRSAAGCVEGTNMARWRWHVDRSMASYAEMLEEKRKEDSDLIGALVLFDDAGARWSYLSDTVARIAGVVASPGRSSSSATAATTWTRSLLHY